MSVAAKLAAEHQALLTAFLAEETARGRRQRGVAGLKHRVPHFLFFLEERGKTALEVTLADAYAFQRSFVDGHTEDGKPYATNTTLSYLGAANAFCQWLTRSSRILGNPFKDMRRVRGERTIPSGILKETEMAAVLDALMSWGTLTHLKDASRRYLVHAVAELQYATGLRIAEAAALRPDDVDVERALVYVKDGKQGSNRIAFLTDYAACVLELYMRKARSLLANGQKQGFADRLFLASFDRLSHTVNEELAVVCAAVGVPAITSHGFRHALGYHLLRGGCPLRYIQAILGHKLMRNTEVYTKVDAEDVKRVFDECHPRMHG